MPDLGWKHIHCMFLYQSNSRLYSFNGGICVIWQRTNRLRRRGIVVKMKISIVTVTFNCQNLIRKTIQSVVEQDFQSVEYLIIDGKSTDGTCSIVRQYARENEIITCISEPDTGIYNAMNKALRYISGDYVLFLNAGDYFYARDTLNHFANYITESHEPDIIYGNTVFYLDEHTIMTEKKNFDWKLVLRAHAVCHQCVLAKTILFKEYSFDESFIYCADRDWLYNMYFRGKKFIHIDEEVVYYEASGFSSQESAQDGITKEMFRIQKKYCRHYYCLNRIRIVLIKIRDRLSEKASQMLLTKDRVDRKR